MSEITSYWLYRYNDENGMIAGGGMVRKATREEYKCFLAAVADEGGYEDETIWMAESGRFDWKAHCRERGWPVDIDCISSKRWNTRELVVAQDSATPEHVHRKFQSVLKSTH